MDEQQHAQEFLPCFVSLWKCWETRKYSEMASFYGAFTSYNRLLDVRPSWEWVGMVELATLSRHQCFFWSTPVSQDHPGMHWKEWLTHSAQLELYQNELSWKSAALMLYSKASLLISTFINKILGRKLMIVLAPVASQYFSKEAGIILFTRERDTEDQRNRYSPQFSEWCKSNNSMLKNDMALGSIVALSRSHACSEVPVIKVKCF